MIYLGGRSTIWNGISVLPDYTNPRQFYYLPPPPRLTLDPASGRQVFKLIKFAAGLSDPSSTTQKAGVLFFDCDVGLTNDELQSLKEQVRQEFQVPSGELNVAPLFYKDGAVECYVLGEQTWSEGEPPQTQNLFVERLEGFGKPSLYDQNRAAFTARLSREGASLLQASLEAGGPIGVSVVYTLKFDALRPAFNFKVEARWEEIYRYFEQKIGLDLFNINIGRTDVVEDLEHKELLRFEEVVYDPDASGELDQIRKQAQQYILEKLFTPVLSTGDPKVGKVPGMIADIMRATVLVPSLSCQRKTLTQTELRSLSFEVSRVGAVERVIYPQANLFAMIPQNELASYTLEVNTDSDLFYRELDVRAVLGGFDFTKSKIAWVHPYVRYGSAPEEHADRALTTMSQEVQLRASIQRQHGYRYVYGYDVEFEPPQNDDPNAIYGGDLRLSAVERAGSQRVVPINPAELFDLREVEFALKKGFPNDRYPTVIVHVKHEDSTGYALLRNYALDTATETSARFRARWPAGSTALTQYRLEYYPAQGLPVTTDWQLASESVVIDNPFPLNFAVRVHIAERAEDLAWADVSLRYQLGDRPGGQQEGRLFFDQDLKPQTWLVNALDPNHRRYQYRFTLSFKDDTQLEANHWIEADAPTLSLGRHVTLQRTINVRTRGPAFDDLDLADISVTLWPETRARDATDAPLVFDATGQTHEVTYRVIDPSQVGYAYEVTYRWRNGRIRTTERASTSGALDLFIPTQIA